jgi:hypothetical protein
MLDLLEVGTLNALVFRATRWSSRFCLFRRRNIFVKGVLAASEVVAVWTPPGVSSGMMIHL